MDIMTAPRRGAVPLFVAGIWYPQISKVVGPDGEGISPVSIWKALKKSQGFPVIVRKALVATEHWVLGRRYTIRRVYPL